MKKLTFSDLNGRKAYINFSALAKVVETARGYAFNTLQNKMSDLQSNISAREGVMPCTIEDMKYTIEALQDANKLLHCLQESSGANKQRKIIIVRDDITIPNGYKLIGEFDQIMKGDMVWDDEECNWNHCTQLSFSQYVNDQIVIRKE